MNLEKPWTVLTLGRNKEWAMEWNYSRKPVEMADLDTVVSYFRAQARLT